ncbi:MAG TPA: DNA polymerase III subunit alpha [Flavobacteriaceae bacterium]|nr:DNA polymerase III subunit alpha [Flavobacteriaceae bacterium]
MYLIFDTETTGLPRNYNAPLSDSDNWPRCVQIAWQLHDEDGKLIANEDFLIRPDGFNIPFDSEKVHGISTELAAQQGVPLSEAVEAFVNAVKRAKFIVGQNVEFDLNIMGAEFYRLGIENPLVEARILDTCTEVTAQLCQIPGGRGGRFKLPTLTELHEFLFEETFQEAHNATADVEATTRCFLELVRRRIFTEEELDVTPDYFENFSKANPQPIQLIGLKHISFKEESEKIRKQIAALTKDQGLSSREIEKNIATLEDAVFVHLHNHSQYSVLQSTSSVNDLVNAAVAHKMPAVALTDSGNMMGAFRFVQAVSNYNKKIAPEEADKKLKAIVGCEFFVCEDHLNKNVKDNGYQVVFLAKSKKGYHNLAKMSSIAYTQGFYYVPRIDKKIVEQYKEDLIVLTGGLTGEVPGKILNVGERQAEEALLWWKKTFGDDLYIEILRHGQEDENRVNEFLVEFSRIHDIKLVACNNTFYINKEDANAHDILLCVKDGEKQATPIGRGRGYRYGLPNQEYYFKSSDEMKELFKDLPEAILNIQEVVDKIESYTLHRDVLLPKFDIPEAFLVAEDEVDGGKRGENKYLRFLTFQGAKKRYEEIRGLDDEILMNPDNPDDLSEKAKDIKERLDFELSVIENTGYPGYFLIVQDFIAEARKMGVSVGPGRGSAAGSAVAYCLGITNICPIKYDLLFERFLNPDRVSMPDIDIDFDDEGRSKVMEYVIKKYGSSQVAQIITYGTMAAKSSIRDTARVLDLPLHEADRISKMIPTMGKLNAIFKVDEENLRKQLRPEDFANVLELRALAESSSLEGQTINQARVLEGSVRNTGIHACGVIITPSDITDFVPVATAKDSDLYVTQFDNSVVESAGLLKMDFLGLKTLTHIKDAVELVKLRHNIEIDPDTFPLDDAKTYELFQRGETVAVFQYESPGMQKYMRELKPTNFADLIAMNALYRPGPMDYIPAFVKRKNGEEEITYDLPDMAEYLEETYGITVYQEQVMLLSQKLAGFTKGEADVLRKAMGKKLVDVLANMKSKFITQAKEKGHDEKILEKIWKDWEAFAHYAFNKSHSTCYAWVAYQTAYLKAHYPAEFMAAVLSNSMNDIKEVSFLMEECRRMGIEILGPDVNESNYKFTVNDRGAIRFGMGAVKGVGRGAVETIVENRSQGKYKSVFDLAKRIDLRAANKRAFENLAYAGGFDGFGAHRAQYLHKDQDGIVFLEKVLRYASKFQENENSAQVSLFGDMSEVQIPEPEVPPCEEWSTMRKLKLEKEVVGLYISGHPLDDYKHEMKFFTTAGLSELQDLEKMVKREVQIGGIVSETKHLESRNGTGFGIFVIEDYEDNFELRMYGEDYLKWRHLMVQNSFVHIRLTVREGWVDKRTGRKKDPSIQVMNVMLLQDVIDKQSKKITIKIPLSEVDEDRISFLRGLVMEYQGNKQLEFVVFEDSMPQTKITMPSRKYKVSISGKLLRSLEKKQLKYRLN